MSSSFVEIPDSPTDIVSSIKFSPVYQHLLTSSWDGSVNLYSTELEKIEQGNSTLIKIGTDTPITDITWDHTGKRAFLANVEGYIKEIDLENGKANGIIGNKHELGVQNLITVPNSNGLLISGSWDKSIQYLDSRSNSSVFTKLLPQKIFAMDSTEQTIVIAMSDRLVHMYDIRNAETPLQVRESGLKYQTRSLKCMPNGQGYAQSSIEGRVAIEYFDPSSSIQEKKYAFKCHRLSAKDIDLVSPVNALSFHHRFGTLFTGGSDSHVCLWDHESKKRLRQYSRFDLSVVNLDFDSKNDILAVGTSDDSFKTGATVDNPVPRIQSKLYLRYLTNSEGLPKKK